MAISGTPVANQIAQWTNATTIQGITTIAAAQIGVHTHAAGDVTSGTFPLTQGAFGQDVSGVTGLPRFAAGTLTFDLANLRPSGANTIREIALTNNQAFEIYETTDSDTTPVNYHKLAVNFAQGSNQVQILSTKGGTGTENGLNLGSDNNIRFQIGGASIFSMGASSMVPNGSKDLGSTANSVKNIYVGPGGTGNGQYWQRGEINELLTIAAATSTDTVGNLLPANSIIRAVVVRVTTAIPTAATFTVGDATTPARFATGVAVAANTTAVGLLHMDPTNTSAAGPVQTSAVKIRITPNATPGAATGVVRISVFFDTFVAPTS